jgi:putative transposase
MLTNKYIYCKILDRGKHLMDKKYKSKKGLVYLNQYHVIFCPKYRRKVLVGDIEKDLKEIFFEVANEN